MKGKVHKSKAPESSEKAAASPQRGHAPVKSIHPPDSGIHFNINTGPDAIQLRSFYPPASGIAPVIQAAGWGAAAGAIVGGAIGGAAGYLATQDVHGALKGAATGAAIGAGLGMHNATKTSITGTTQKIKYYDLNTLNIEEQEVGHTVDAHLVANDPKQGSDSDASANPDLYQSLDHFWFSGNGASTWKRGHLLNANLGGPNNPANLFPLTTAANSNHSSQVEEHVKQWIANGRNVDYKVKAVVNTGNVPTGLVPPNPVNIPNARGRLECVATSSDGRKINKTIHSIPALNLAGHHAFADIDRNIVHNAAEQGHYGPARLATPAGWQPLGSQQLGVQRGLVRHSRWAVTGDFIL